MTIEYLSVEGTPEMMGLAHGEQFKKKILFLIEERTSILFKCIPKLTIERLNKVSQEHYEYFKKNCPILDQEVEAIAKAAGLKPYQLIQAGGYTDLLDSLSASKILDVSECSIAINPKEGYMAGTWDSHPSAIEGLILLKRNPNNTNVKTLALTTAGWPAQQGINSCGLAFSITNLTPKNSKRTGMNYISANAVMSNCDSINMFLCFVRKVKFCSGHSYLMLDSKGRGCTIETNANSVASKYLSKTYVMTNHYQLNPPLDDNSNYRYLKGSINRKLEMETINTEFNSPEHFSKCISQSQYINKKNSHDVSMTCAHFFLVPQKQELYFSKGPSIGKAMTKVTLD